MNNNTCRFSQFSCFQMVLSGLLIVNISKASSTWTALNNAPPVGVNNCLLLSDGTVLGMNGAGQCVKLTPDIHGSYVNGTWTTLATMNSSRLFFSSVVLTNGNVFVAGGEYGDANHYDAELYDSQANTWTVVPGSQSPNFNYSDSPAELLPNGNVLVSDSQSTYQFYNVASNIMTYGGTCGDMNEVCWVKLANGSIFGVDNYGNAAEHYVSSTGGWVIDATSTPSGFQGGDDMDYLLPDGRVFHAGSTPNTGFYTPGTTATSAGNLVNGPNLPMDATGTNQLVAGESPGAMLITGNILLDLAPNGGGAAGGSPCYFYEYNYTSNTFTKVSAPGGGSTYGSSPFVNSMLDLPDGSVLFVGGQNSTSFYIYTPQGTPLAAERPIINSLNQNLDGSYHLTGIGLNGISEGAMFGDDEQMACNYPLVRLTNNVSGNVYYARSYNWNSTTVQNNNPVTTEFALPQNLPVGTYSLVVTAVGNPSAPVTFAYAPPAAPTGLTGTAGDAQTVLSWNAVSGATAYNVKTLLTISPLRYTTVATVTSTSCTNLGLVNGRSYFYAVSAVSAGGESTNSTPLLLVPFGPPPVPTGVTAAVIPNNFADAQINLAWTASYGATNYNIRRSTVHNGPYTNLAASVAPSYADASPLIGKTYYYVVSAVGTGGESSNSAEANTAIQLATNVCLPVTAADVVGSQVTFMATFSGGNLRYQWQKILGGVTNIVAGATNTIFTLANLQLTDTASYQLKATNTLGGVYSSTLGSLTVNSVPAPVNNIITTYAAQTGRGNTGIYTNFVPTWTEAPGSLIFGQSPSSVGSGDFSQYFSGPVSVLTDGTFGWLNYWPNTGSSPALVTCGGSAGQSVTYALANSTSGYNLANIVVYGGWGDAGRDQQAYTVYYSTVAAPANFIQLSTINYNPANASSVQSATRATLMPASGFLATNVAAVMFDFTSPAPENGYCGYSDIEVFGSFPPPLQTAPYLTTNTLPVTAVDVVGSQVTFMAAFNGTNPIAYQWQKLKSGVANTINDPTNTILTLTHLQLTDTASYQLRASNVQGVTASTPGSLTVNSVSPAVNNVITSVAAQTGISGTLFFIPTWTVTQGSLIAGQLPNSLSSGNFSQAGAGTISVLTDGSFGSLNYQPGNGSSPTEVTCGGSAGQSVIYTLSGSGSGYSLTNIVVYGGWGDSGRDQQAYTIYYSQIADPTTFIQLGSVNYNPSNPSGTLSGTRATLTPASGALATNVAALKFDFTSPAPENGYCGYSEIQVFGTASIPPALPANLNATLQVGPPNFTMNIGNLVVGRNYSLQCTTNLVSPVWLIVTNFVATQTVATFSDSTASDSQKFYRVAGY